MQLKALSIYTAEKQPSSAASTEGQRAAGRTEGVMYTGEGTGSS